MNEVVEEIYLKNQKMLNSVIEQQVKNEVDKLTDFIDLRKDNKLKELIVIEVIKKIKREIEYKFIIEKLYSDNEKEKALQKLPQYILELC